MNRNLIFFLPTFKVGGAGNSIFRLCKKLDLRQNNLFIISIGKNEYKKKFLQHSNKKYLILLKIKKKLFLFLINIMQM